MSQHVYIASHDARGGILHCILSDQGKLSLVHRTEIGKPSYLCAEGNRLYALLREPFMMQSGIAAFRIQPDGALEREGEIQPTHGSVAAYVYVRGGRLYAANYLSGTVIALPDRMAAYSGRSIHPRQDCSHPHCITPTPDGNYLCINDLGTDTIHVCTPDLATVSQARVPEGYGPRHLVFSSDGCFAYSINELASNISVFSYGDGKLTYIASYSTLPEDSGAENTAGAIRISRDGTTLYASNRGHDTVAAYQICGPELKNLRHYPTGGGGPRDFACAGDYLLCGNDDSGTVTVLSLKDGGKVVDTLGVSHPWCIFPCEIP